MYSRGRFHAYCERVFYIIVYCLFVRARQRAARWGCAMKRRYSFAIGARVSVRAHGQLCNATIIARAVSARGDDVYLVRVHHSVADDVVLYYASAIRIRASQ